MRAAELPYNEPLRLDALFRYDILDTPSERSYDNLVSLASTICNKPISLVSLVDDHRQWFKAKVGLQACETEKSLAFCSHALLQNEVFVIENALEDDRFSDNPLVVGEPHVIFYAGAPLITPDGFALGTLCVIDNKPGSLTEEQQKALKILADQVVVLLELRLNNKKTIEVNKEKRLLIRLLAQEIRTNFNTVSSATKLIKKRITQEENQGLNHLIDNIDQCAKHTTTIVDRALQWARIRKEANKQESLNQPTTDISSVVQNACERELPTAQSRDVSFNLHCESASYAKVDPALLASVVQNLIQNAVRYSPKGDAVEVTVSKEGKNVNLKVKDNGKGMSKTRVESLFYKNALDEIDENDAVGMGCLLAQEFVRQYKGSLVVESEPGMGTNIILSLPAAQ